MIEGQGAARPRPAVLIVDDEVRSLETLTRILDEEFEVRTAGDAATARQILEEGGVQAVLSDQRMPGETGVEFLAGVREQWPEVVRIIVSGYTDAEDIIEGVNRAGIYQYLTKPWHPENLLLTVRNACRLYQLQRDNEMLALEMKLTAPRLEQQITGQREWLKRNFQFSSVIRSPDSPLNGLCDQIRAVAPFDISVLVTGESGTGKELCARALHYNSLRADRPFVVENCGALPDTLLESELFGHRKGAYTGAVADRVGLFEQADGGTIFLDEIGDVSPAFQVKLLRVLQEGEIRPLGSNQRRRVNIRVIAATNKDLEREIRAGRFREDLYYRLAGVCLTVPPLRARSADIPALADDLLRRAMAQHGKQVQGFTAAALAGMQAYHWPGNVRELQNEVQRMLVMAGGPLLGVELLSPHVSRPEWPVASPGGAAPADPGGGGLKEQVERLEARILRETLQRHRWNKSRAAEELGLSRVGLRNKLERYGLERQLDG